MDLNEINKTLLRAAGGKTPLRPMPFPNDLEGDLKALRDDLHDSNALTKEAARIIENLSAKLYFAIETLESYSGHFSDHDPELAKEALAFIKGDPK
ncbi:hypothetical protein RPALISO_184 [Ruegeria phage RpAliso]|nr:hypothetical protein RPALISO_184 [Ruegeria phage RpAliso]